MNTKLKDLILHLNLISGVGPATILSILKNCFNIEKNSEVKKINRDPAELYDFSSHDFIYQAKISEKIAKYCAEGLKNKALLDKEMKSVEKSGAQLLSIICNDYPVLLAKIHNPPPILYFQGNKSFSEKNNISFVGSRNGNSYGKRVLEMIIPGLVEKNYNITSGGAIGIDAFSHEETIKAAGTTTAILGSGLNHLYPKMNIPLFEKIKNDNGAIVSAFSMSAPPEKQNFPIRNRIIAGMSFATCVIQANAKSGALITADYALEENREVFAVPGPIDCPLSEGCNKLIDDGAGVLRSFNSILLQKAQENNSVVEKNISPQNSNLDSLALKIVRELYKAKNTEQLSLDLKCEQSKLEDTLFDLQLEGHVKQNFTGTWEAC